MKKSILNICLIFSVGALPLCGQQAVEALAPPDEDSAILPAEPIAYVPPQEEKKESLSWKRAGMVLFTIATITAGIAVASSNNGKSV